MGATTVTGTILGVDNAVQVGVYVTFRLKSTGTDSAATSTIDQDAISVITDASGQFSTTLWDNGDSGVTSILEIRMPSGQRHDVIIPAADATIDIWDLIENYTVGTAAPQLPTNEALFMRKANDLSDVASVSTSRTNLGLGTAATTAATDYATAAQGVLADAALPKTGGAMTGAITTSSTFDGRDVATDGTKLDTIETSADVTDATNVVAAGGYIAGGTDVAIADGGTGASTEATARTNLEFQTNVTGATTAVTVTSYAVLTTDHTLTVDETAIGGNVTINLPPVATVGSGFELSVKKTGSTFSTTLDGDGTEPIDDGLTEVLAVEDEALTIRANTTGWDIISRNGIGLPLDYVQFNTTPPTPVYTAGRVHWEADESTLEIDTGIDNVAIQVGQENVIRVRNSTGGTLVNGSVVRISGATGNRPNIILAQADTSANASGTIGITTHDIENNTDGFVTTSGLVRDLNTSSYTEGDPVYLSSTVPGGLTDVEPTIQVRIGFVTVSNISTGVILVAIESHIPVYGSIYVDSGAVAQTIATGASYTKSTAFTTDGNDSGGISDVANDQLVLTRGAWHITSSVSFFTDTNTNDVYGALFLDGTEAANLHFIRTIGTGSDKGSASISGIVVVDQDTETLDFRLRHNVGSAEDVTIVYANLNGHKISN